MSGKLPMPFNDFVESSLQAMSPKMPQLPPIFLPDDRPPGRPPPGLFQQMLNGEVGVLFSDSRERPELYDPPTTGILSELASGQRTFDSLNAEERQLLDLATAVYATSPVKPKEQVRDQKRILKSVTRKLAPMPPRPSSAPEHSLPPYWWLGRDEDGRE